MKTIWSSKSVTRKAKLKLYRTLVVLVLLYGCETWKMNNSDGKEIDVLQNKCLRKILEVRWHARPLQYRRVIRESRDGVIEQRCKKTKMQIDRIHTRTLVIPPFFLLTIFLIV